MAAAAQQVQDAAAGGAAAAGQEAQQVPPPQEAVADAGQEQDADQVQEGVDHFSGGGEVLWTLFHFEFS